MYPVEIKTERLIIRDLAVSDVQYILSIYRDEEIKRLYAWSPPTTLDEYIVHLQLDNVSVRAPGRSKYQLALTRGAELVGKCGLLIESEPYARGEITYMLGASHRGSGIATEGVGAVVRFGFEELGLHRIAATSHPENRASQRVLEKLGFSLEGRLRDYKRIQGEWRDSLLFARLATD